MYFYFEAFSVSYQQCAGGGSLANQEIERVYKTTNKQILLKIGK